MEAPMISLCVYVNVCVCAREFDGYKLKNVKHYYENAIKKQVTISMFAGVC